jgi:hypothetical protein
MNTIVIQSVRVPSPREFGLTWKSFFLVVSAIASYRAKTYGPHRFGDLSVHASNLLGEVADTEEMHDLIRDMADHEQERVSLGILYEEMKYIAWKYRNSLEIAGMEVPEYIQAMEEAEQFSGEEGHPGDPGVVDDVETVVGSVKAILDKLPRWVRKTIEALMELLKLTRGELG